MPGSVASWKVFLSRKKLNHLFGYSLTLLFYWDSGTWKFMCVEVSFVKLRELSIRTGCKQGLTCFLRDSVDRNIGIHFPPYQRI
uniref:Uncharacterized protein n=1 Tax=Solanum lycopersicum TaxID=4081 RepID=A0A3Q7FKW6_SOLLC